MILRIPDVMRTTGLSRTTIYRLIGRGDFPRGVRLAGNAVGWLASEIQEWADTRPRAVIAPQERG